MPVHPETRSGGSDWCASDFARVMRPGHGARMLEGSGGKRRGENDAAVLQSSAVQCRDKEKENANADLDRGHGSSFLRGLKQLPLAGNVVRSEPCDDAVSDLGEAIRRKGEDGWSSAGKTDTQKTGLGGGRH